MEKKHTISSNVNSASNNNYYNNNSTNVNTNNNNSTNYSVNNSSNVFYKTHCFNNSGSSKPRSTRMNNTSLTNSVSAISNFQFHSGFGKKEKKELNSLCVSSSNREIK